MRFHNKYYYEKLAQLTLTSILSFSQDTLVLSDKPDLQDYSHNIGVEVVQDTYPNERQLKSFWIKYEQNTTIDSIPKKQIDGYIKRGGKLKIENRILRGGSLGPQTPNNLVHLVDTIKKKQQRLNSGGYQLFETNALFVIVETVSPLFDSYVDSIIQSVNIIEYDYNFDYLFLYCHYELILCDLSKQTHSRFPISKEVRERIEDSSYRYSEDLANK